MPYITPLERKRIDVDHDPYTLGQLNYMITTLITEFIGEEVDYAAINGVIGVLECAKLELYRRVAAPYEDQKMEDNGDVYY